MDILITNGSIFQENSYSGGAELSFEYLAKYLSKNHNVKVITGHRYKSIKTLHINNNLVIDYINDKQFLGYVDQELSMKHYDYVLTQLIWSEFTMGVCSKYRIPCVYFVRSLGIKLDLSSNNPEAPAILVGNTHYVRSRLKQVYARGSLVLYPCIDFDRVKATSRTDPKLVGMFNPIKIKGGEVFEKIAKGNPHRKFIAVRGWANLKDDKNN